MIERSSLFSASSSADAPAAGSGEPRRGPEGRSARSWSFGNRSALSQEFSPELFPARLLRGEPPRGSRLSPQGVSGLGMAFATAQSPHLDKAPSLRRRVGSCCTTDDGKGKGGFSRKPER